MKRAIGVDPGDARVGLAISDDLGMLAHPLETIDARRPGSAKSPASPAQDGLPASQRALAAVAARIASVAAERGAATVVVGLPLNMDGTAGAAAAKARELAASLRALGGFDVVEWDERMTTLAAQRQFREAGRSRKKCRGQIDQAAAVLILQSWLDAQQLRSGNPL